MSSERLFKRLPAKRRGFVRRASLWDAGDYLLSVSGTTFSERYHRFYYRDIKSIVVQSGPRVGSLGAMLLLLFLSFTFGVSILATPHSPSFLWAFCIVPLLGLLFMIYINVARSCRVFLYTAVSSEELPALFRRSAAKRVLPKILEKIHNAQGDFDVQPEVHATDPAEWAQPLTAEAALPAPSSAPGEPGIVSPAPLYISLLYFLVLFGSAAFAFWYRNTSFTPSSLATGKVFFSLLNALAVGTGVWAIVKLFRIRLFNNLRIVIFAGLGIQALRTYSLAFTVMALSTKNGTISESMVSVRWRQWSGTADCAISTILAVTGLILLMWAWQNQNPDSVANSSITGGSLSNL